MELSQRTGQLFYVLLGEGHPELCKVAYRSAVILSRMKHGGRKQLSVVRSPLQKKKKAEGYAVGGWRSAALEVGGSRLRLRASAFVKTSARQVGAARRTAGRMWISNLELRIKEVASRQKSSALI
jgi:hypothetical protein